MVQLVGRDRPVAQLRAEIDRTVTSHGGLVFVTGEAGIGKTTLVGEALRDLTREEAWLVHATCWEREGAPGYWPWVQVVRGLIRTVDDGIWQEARARTGGELAVLLGEATLRNDPRNPQDDGFGVADAVTTLLITLSRCRPLIIVLDDLHWSDLPSLKALEFAARHGWFEQLLIISTFRDDEVQQADHPLRPSLLHLASKASTISLTGLDRTAVAHLLTEVTGSTLPDRLVDDVHRRTGGNPFFVDQTAQIWASTGTIDTVAPQVRDAVDRRLGLLPPELVDLLRMAAVLGPDFTVDRLAETTGTDAATVRHLLEQALAARLLLTGTSSGNTWSFAHDLVRDALYSGLPPDEARRHHAAALAALERTARTRPTDTRPDPSDLAHHAYLAVPEVAPAVAADHLRTAAQAAGQRFAADEEAAHLRRALELIPQDDARTWAAVAADFGANLYTTGDSAGAIRTFREIADLARKTDDAELLARAALRLRGLVWLEPPSGEAEFAAISLIRDAHTRLLGALDPADPGDDVSRPGDDRRREEELSARVLEVTRAAGDDKVLAEALMARYDAVWRPGTSGERIRIGTEFSALATAASDIAYQLLGAYMTFSAQVEHGDPNYLHQAAHIEALARDLDALLPCGVNYWTASEAATFQGRFDESVRWLDLFSELDNQPDDSDETFKPIHGSALGLHQQWATALLHGRLEDAVALAGSAAERGHPQPELLRAIALTERGDHNGARQILDRITPDTMIHWFEPLRLRLRAQLAAACGEPDRIRTTEALLEPLKGRWLVTHGDLTHGPATYWLGVLAAARGDRDVAVAHFTAAADSADRMGARPWAVRARTELAATLSAADHPEAAPRVTALLDEVETEAARLEMHHQITRVDQVRESATVPPEGPPTGPGAADTRNHADERFSSPTPTAPAVPVVPTSPTNEFRREGDVWVLTYRDRTVHVPDAKGLRDLHQLLAQPGESVAAADLFAPDGGPEVQAARHLGGDTVLDEQAKLSYRRRLEELDSEIDRALGRGNDRKAAELDSERAALIDELRRATGLGGRARRLGSDAERARKAVSERIRDTLRRLDRRHPELAGHLRDSISTGNRCRYEPAEDPTWRL